MLDWIHEIVREGGTWVVATFVGWLGSKVKRFARDLNCYFSRTRALEAQNRWLKARVEALEEELGVKPPPPPEDLQREAC